MFYSEEIIKRSQELDEKLNQIMDCPELQLNQLRLEIIKEQEELNNIINTAPLLWWMR